MSNGLVVVVGAGPGLGAAVARRFGRDGLAVALLARDAERLADLVAGLRAEGIDARSTAVDIADDAALRAAVTDAAGPGGRIDVLHYNPSIFRQQDPLALSPEEVCTDMRTGVTGLLVALQAARPFLVRGSRVTATGSVAADRPWHEAASLGMQKAALRNLVRSIDASLAPDGIRAVSVTVVGTLAPGTRFDPALVADAIHAAAHQDEDAWEPEVRYEG